MSYRWLPENISRADAERKLLSDGMATGSFIVRKVEKSKVVTSVLSVRHKENVKHYDIKKFNNGYFGTESGPVFHGLRELVLHYMTDADDLPCKLCPTLPGTMLNKMFFPPSTLSP